MALAIRTRSMASLCAFDAGSYVQNIAIKPATKDGKSSPFDGGLIKMGRLFERGGAYLIWKKKMVSVLHKELKYKVEKFKNKKFGGFAAEDQNQIGTSSW